MAALPTFIPLHAAAKKLGITEARLRSLIDAGRLKAAEVNGEIVVSEESLPKRKEELTEYKLHAAKWKGTKISISDASRDYGIPTGTITRWVQSGIIQKLGSDGYRTFIDKGDIVYCSRIYHHAEKVGKQGRRLFNADGTPYIAKTSI